MLRALLLLLGAAGCASSVAQQQQSDDGAAAKCAAAQRAVEAAAAAQATAAAAAVAAMLMQAPSPSQPQSPGVFSVVAFGADRAGRVSRQRDCHFDDTPFLCLLKHLLQVEGGAAE